MGFGFVAYKTPQQAEKALKQLQVTTKHFVASSTGIIDFAFCFRFDLGTQAGQSWSGDSAPRVFLLGTVP